MEKEDLEIAIQQLKEISEDTTAPKNVQTKAQQIIKMIQDQNKLEISKALYEIEELTEETTLPPFTRTQLLSISSLLEKP